jgi:hypothetical protein
LDGFDLVTFMHDVSTRGPSRCERSDPPGTWTGPLGAFLNVPSQMCQRAKAHVAFGRSFVPVHPHRTVYELRRNGGRVATDIPHAVAGGLCFCRVALGTTPNWHPGPSGSADVAQKSRPKVKAVLVRGRLNLTPQPMNNSYAKG